MPRFSDHFVKSLIRLVRQSTQVPNTSNTSAFTPEISDMSAPIFLLLIPSKHLAVLDESEIVGDRIIEGARLRVARLRQPIDAARVRRPGPVVNRLDERASEPSAPRGFRDKQILQIAVSLGSPGRTMKEIVSESCQVSIDVAAERKHRLIGIVKAGPGEIAHVPRQRRLVKGEIARPQRIPGFALVFTKRSYQEGAGHALLNRGGISRAGGDRP